MPIAPVNSIEICYETYGSESDPALVLINGLGSQMIRWPAALRDALVNAGYRVIVLDNRDVGLSSKLEGIEYTVADMARDVIGVLDHIGVPRAHVAGMSMGGMIAQVLATQHTDRVLSLTSIMSAMGDDPVLSTNSEAVAIFAEPAETERSKAIEQDVRHRRLISGPGFPFDEDAARDLATRCFDRCYAPDGRMRQMLAVRSSPGRKAALASLDLPTAVIHGTHDPLVDVENGRRMAATVPGATLTLIEGMGHDLPAGAIPQIVDAIVANARRARVRA